MNYYEDRIKALEARVEEMAMLNRIKAIPVEAKLIDRIAELTAEVKSLKEKMETLPTRRIGDRWYTEGEFQQRIQDARIWRL
jgi:hypothetical protein